MARMATTSPPMVMKVDHFSRKASICWVASGPGLSWELRLVRTIPLAARPPRPVTRPKAPKTMATMPMGVCQRASSGGAGGGVGGAGGGQVSSVMGSAYR